MKLFISLTLCLFFFGLGCKQTETSEIINDFTLINYLQKGLMNTVSEDLFTPPVASRIYAYSHLAGYEALRHYHQTYKSFSELVAGLDVEVNQDAQGLPQAAFIESFCLTANHLVYRDYMIQSLKERVVNYFAIDTLDEAYLMGGAVGRNIANQVIQRADNDGYLQTRTLPKYMPNEHPGSWQATAPTFGEALEPHWPKLTPFIVDSASQFRSKLPITFNADRGSAFYREAEKVQGYVARADEDSVAVALYWDCNPGPTMLDGHFMQVRKQNTPAGHWLGIVSQMCQMHNMSLMDAAQLYTKVALGIADGFICAWDTKYAYDLLRPETYINTYIDSDWRPKLESPLFPEYSSAHSIVSAVAATILTDALGESVSFTDSTNVKFGLPVRSFNSFWEAANEAATSRLLGGIHYPFACQDGIIQGKEIGAYLLNEF